MPVHSRVAPFQHVYAASAASAHSVGAEPYAAQIWLHVARSTIAPSQAKASWFAQVVSQAATAGWLCRRML